MALTGEHFSDEDLVAFATGKIDTAIAERCEVHIQKCDDCGARLDSLIRSDSLVGRLRDGAESGDSVVNSIGDTADAPASSAAASSPALPLHGIGKAFRNHRLISILGSGGMGVVYRAHDSLIGRDVALKVLHESVARDPNSRARFLAEARVQGQLNHRNVVTIYAIDELESTMYIVMEILSGGSMADRIKQTGPLPWLEATRAVMQACRGLAAAHAADLIHRDIKPENLLIDDDGNVKLGDFGLAKSLDAASITHSNHVVGTPHFMSPEQCRCEQIDSRSDIYQIGATFFTLLTGRNPYPQATTPLQAIHAHCQLPVPDPREVDAEIPDECAAIVMQAMAKNVDDRFQSADELFVELIALHDEPPKARPARRPLTGRDAKKTSSRSTDRTQRSGARPFLALLPLVVLALLAVVGYRNRASRPDSHNRESGAKPTAFIATSDADPIKVGILHSLSGTMADSEAPVVDAALLAIEELNEAGGLLGRKVAPIVADGRSDPATFAREAERLITQDEVSVIFGCWTSASRKTIVPVFERHDHLLIYPVQYEGLEQSPNVIYTGAAPNQQLIPAVKWAFAFENKRRFFLVGSDYVFPRTAHEIIKDVISELGAEVVGEEYIPLGSSHVEAVVDEIVSSRPDVILNTINGDSNVAFFRVLRGRGITPAIVPTISFSFGEAELRQLDVSRMIGDFACWTYFQSLNDPVNERFVKRFHTKYGPQRVITDPMEASYFGVKLWAQAAVEAESTDAAETRKAILGIQFRAPQGFVKIDPETQHAFKTPRIGRVMPDGQFETVWEATQPTPPVPFPQNRTHDQWKQFHREMFDGWDGQWSAPTRKRANDAINDSPRTDDPAENGRSSKSH